MVHRDPILLPKYLERRTDPLLRESRKRLRGYFVGGSVASQVEKLFALLIESGAIYCALWVSLFLEPHPSYSDVICNRSSTSNPSSAGICRSLRARQPVLRATPIARWRNIRTSRSVPGGCRRSSHRTYRLRFTLGSNFLTIALR